MSQAGAGRRARLTLPARLEALPVGTGLAVAGMACTLLFLGLYGSLRPDTAMIMTLAWALLLGAALLSPWGRRAMERSGGLALPGGLFVLTIAAGLWSLTPWTPGGPHPAWSYVGMRGSASIDPSSTIVELVKLMGFACAFLFGALAGSLDGRARAALRFLVYAGAVLAALAFLVFVAGFEGETQAGRFEAYLLSPNTAGTVCGALFLLAVADLNNALRAAPRSARDGPLVRAAGPASAAAVLLGCLVSTVSRGAMGATAIALLVQLGWGALSSRRRKGRLLFGAVALAVVAGGAVIVVGERLLGRFDKVHDDAVIRGDIFAAHWKAFLASPLSGYGLGGFDPLNHALLSQSNFQVLSIIRAAHNVYIQWLEEAGLAGAIPMFLTIAVVIATTVRGTLRRSRMKAWLHALVGVDLVFLLHGMSDFALQTPAVASFWAVLLGVQFTAAQGSSRRAG